MPHDIPAIPTQDHRLSSCECGALQLRVTGEPVHLHACTRCQRASGSAIKMSAWYAEASVTIKGAYVTYFNTGATDPQRMAGFCPICGGGRFFRSGDYLPGTIAIAVGNFADPDYPAPDHIHRWPDRPRWLGAPLGPLPLPGN